MIPIRDVNPSHTFPIVTYSLIVANVLVFFYQVTLTEPKERDLFQDLALKPAFVIGYFQGEKVGLYPDAVRAQDLFGREVVVTTERMVPLDFWNSLFPFLSSLFLHGGLAHILGNLWFLHIFGDNVEDRLGHLRYFLFYLLAGVLASAAQVLVTPVSAIPTIGASGAISGVLGAYVIAFPRARVLSIIPIGFFFPLIEIPAFVFLFIWFAIQLASGLFSSPGQGGVAFWAHIGGFVAGMGAIFLLSPRRPSSSGWGRVSSTFD